MNKADLAYMVTDNILAELNGRAGFDDWWYEIDAETKDEIRNALARIIYESYEDLEDE